MAGRVNTKFVALLVGAAVLVLGAGVGLYYYMFNKTGETYAVAAREAEAAGDWETAEERWGNAVGQERTNVAYLDGWANALGHLTPDTETEYDNKFTELQGIIRQIANTTRTDIERTQDYLQFLYDRIERTGRFSRGWIDRFDSEFSIMIAYYPEGGPLQDQRDALRRYRAMVWAKLSGASSTLKDEEIESAIADAEAALRVNPGDGEVMRALVQLLDTQKSRAESNGRLELAEEFRDEQRAAVAGVLGADPENFWGLITGIEIDAEEFAKLSGDARESARMPMFERLLDLMEMVEPRVAELEPSDLNRLTLLEGLLSGTNDSSRTIGLYEKAIAAQGERTELLFQLASLRDRAGDYEGALADAAKIEAQEWLPVSLDGYVRMFVQKQAPMLVAEITIGRLDTVESDEEVASLIETAKAARDRFVEGVGSENARVSMLDGQIAAARAEYLGKKGDQRAAEDALNIALGHFSSFNEQTDFSNREGLWREGLTATRLNKTGLARDRLSTLLQMEPKNANVLLGLADVEERLGTDESLDEAKRYTERAAELAPGNERIQQRLERLRRLTLEYTPDDPIDALVVESERVYQGRDALKPDAIKAEQIIRGGLEEHGLDPLLVRQIARLLLFTNRYDEAVEITARGLEANPDSEIMQELAKRLEAGSMLDIEIGSIEDSNRSDLDKLLQKVEAYRQYGEPELASQALAEAIALSPDDPDVIEQQFLQALSAGDMELAKQISQRAKANNADRLDGITYQARVFAAENKHPEAVELLREAVARRSTDAPLWRLLASEQAALGRISQALESYRRSLGITVNDPTTIRGYIALLASSGQLEEALSEARRLRSFGEVDPVFMDIYLRLEATEGGDEGLATAIQMRQRILGERPFDAGNKLQLARLYIDAREWDKAKTILDDLEGDENLNELARIEMLAKWYADQGRVKIDDEYRDGIELARGTFINYILESGEGSSVDAYITMARFMMQRGRDDVALRAVEEARANQDPDRLRAEKLYGEIMMRRNMPRQASEAFRRVVEAGADEDGDNYRKLLIEMLLRTSEFEAAKEQIALLEESVQRDLTVLMQRADIAMAQNDQEEALRLVDRAIELYPSRPLPFIKRAQFQMPNEALARDVMRNLEEALRLNPNDFQAHKLMATMHYRTGNDDEAVRALRASLRANPGQDGVLVGLLIELLEKDRVGEAIDVANEVIEARPTDATLMLVAGRVFMRRGYHDRAATLFEQAWDLTRDQRVAMAYIDSLLRSDNPKTNEAARVIAQLEVLGAEINDDPQLLATRAAIEAKGGKNARAASFLTRAYEQSLGNPALVLQWVRNVRVAFDDDASRTIAYILELRNQVPAGSIQHHWLTYGAALVRTQDEIEIAEAEADLIRLQTESEDSVIQRLSHRMLGSGRYGREDYEGAVEAWQAGIAAFPDDWEMHNNLAYCIGIDLGRPAEGVPLARQATVIADPRADVHDTLGKLLLASGELDEAEDSLLKAKERVRTERERVNVLINLARLAIARGNLDEARRLSTDADNTVYTLPDLREFVGDDLAELKQEIDSAQAAD
jgi:tetratricopeptide (TPR) repeat protein